MIDTSSANTEASEIVKPDYSDTEKAQIGVLMSRLLKAKTDRDKLHPEFDGKTFEQEYAKNESIANTQTPKKEFDDGIKISSGTVEQKLFIIASEINRLNLTAEVRAYDQEDNEMASVGNAFTDIIFKTQEMEGDPEKKLHRLIELLKQGTVFVQENWIKKYKYTKDFNNIKIGSLDTNQWRTKLEKISEGRESQILYSPGVYLGNIREFDIKKQPFLFTHKITSYHEAQTRYGGKDADGKYIWERWENVPKNRVTLVTSDNVSKVDVNDGFGITDLTDGQVEEIHYQDSFNNEYQIFLNGIPMLPIGFPLSAISPSGEYNITKQVLQIINPFFAYGRSFVSKTQNMADLLDETIRLIILKFRKSIHPPYANTSGKVISPKSLMPGRITMGIDPQALQKIGEEGQGVNSSEYQMLREMQDMIDKVTISPQLEGQLGKAGTTALEASIVAKQAQKFLSLIVFAASLLEQKLAYLILDNILGNYFNPVDTIFDESKKQIVNKFRQTSRSVSIDRRGKGTRKIIPTDQTLPTSEEIMDQEDFSGTPEGSKKTREQLGMEPLEIVYLNPEQLRNIKAIFHIQVDAKERDTGENARAAFQQELRVLAGLMTLGSKINIADVEENYSKVYNKKKDRTFLKQQNAVNQVVPDSAKTLMNDNTGASPGLPINDGITG